MLTFKGDENKNPVALVLVPTKELAEQVTQVFNQMTTYCDKLVRAINLTTASEQVQKCVPKPSRLISERNFPNVQKLLFLHQPGSYIMSLRQNYHCRVYNR